MISSTKSQGWGIADEYIDLGPGAGDAGGYIVATGTPEEITHQESSATGQYLKRVLRGESAIAVKG